MPGDWVLWARRGCLAVAPMLFLVLLQTGSCGAPTPASPPEDAEPYATPEPTIDTITTPEPPPSTTTPLPPLTAPNRPPLAGPIVAVLAPPTTRYGVKAVDPDGHALRYNWYISPGACGVFSWEAGTAERPMAHLAAWDHPHPGSTAIKCGNDVSHPGIVTVEITDAYGGKVVRTYSGSVSGAGDVPPREPQPPDPKNVPGLTP